MPSEKLALRYQLIRTQAPHNIDAVIRFLTDYCKINWESNQGEPTTHLDITHRHTLWPILKTFARTIEESGNGSLIPDKALTLPDLFEKIKQIFILYQETIDPKGRLARYLNVLVENQLLSNTWITELNTTISETQETATTLTNDNESRQKKRFKEACEKNRHIYIRNIIAIFDDPTSTPRLVYKPKFQALLETLAEKTGYALHTLFYQLSAIQRARTLKLIEPEFDASWKLKAFLMPDTILQKLTQAPNRAQIAFLLLTGDETYLPLLKFSEQLDDKDVWLKHACLSGNDTFLEKVIDKNPALKAYLEAPATKKQMDQADRFNDILTAALLSDNVSMIAFVEPYFEHLLKTNNSYLSKKARTAKGALTAIKIAEYLLITLVAAFGIVATVVTGGLALTVLTVPGLLLKGKVVKDIEAVLKKNPQIEAMMFRYNTINLLMHAARKIDPKKFFYEAYAEAEGTKRLRTMGEYLFEKGLWDAFTVFLGYALSQKAIVPYSQGIGAKHVVMDLARINAQYTRDELKWMIALASLKTTHIIYGSAPNLSVGLSTYLTRYMNHHLKQKQFMHIIEAIHLVPNAGQLIDLSHCKVIPALVNRLTTHAETPFNRDTLNTALAQSVDPIALGLKAQIEHITDPNCLRQCLETGLNQCIKNAIRNKQKTVPDGLLTALLDAHVNLTKALMPIQAQSNDHTLQSSM